MCTGPSPQSMQAGVGFDMRSTESDLEKVEKFLIFPLLGFFSDFSTLREILCFSHFSVLFVGFSILRSVMLCFSHFSVRLGLFDFSRLSALFALFATV